MPNFLHDDTAQFFSCSSDVLDLDPTNTFGLAHNKDHHGAGAIHPTRSHYANESFDESSTSSTQLSDIVDAPSGPADDAPVTPFAASMTLSNGTTPYPPPTLDSTPAHQRPDDKRLLNGDVLPPPSMPPPPPPAPQGRPPDPPSKQPPAVPPKSSAVDRSSVTSSASHGRVDPNPARLSSSSMNSPAPPSPSPVERHQPSAANGSTRLSDGHLSNLAPTGSTTLLNPASALSPHHNIDMSQNRIISPHRLSSPPTYHPPGVPSSSSLAISSPGSSNPPGPGNLKQRHTLEVPRPQPGRSSKDGMDAAYASGRFSPTGISASGVRRGSLSLVRRTTRSIQSEHPRDEVFPDEDAMRWAEAYRQKRASKRRRREEEDDDRVLVGTKVDEHHVNWVTAYNMLTGIRVSVSRTNAKLDRELTPADFDAKQKSTFDIAGNEMVPSAKYDFKFKDYAPWVFRHLRTQFRLDPADYLMSLTGKYILSELGSPGKSGSFFYFSRDYKYIIKTIHHAEHKFLRKILKDYYNHVVENPNTLLSQFYGLHRVKMPYGKKIHFVVMNNLFPPHRDIHQTFDLKGSTLGREYQEEGLQTNPRATLKDVNWIRRRRNLELGIQKKRLFLEQLQRDVALLKRLQIMDYSLLIGIHDVRKGNEENLRDKTLRVFNPGGERAQDDGDPPSVLLRTPSKLENARKARELRQMIRQERPVPMGESASRMPDELDEGQNRPGFVFNQDDGGFRATHEDNSPANEVYYLGVIDCLTHYGIIKKIETFWKGLSSDRSKISSVPPDEYGERFYKFVAGVTKSPEEAAREEEAQRQQETTQVVAEGERVSSWTSSVRRRSMSQAPPIPNYLPPPPPPPPHDNQTSDLPQTDAKATSEPLAPPTRVLSTVKVPSGEGGPQHDSILPVVEEAGEASSLGGRSRDGDGDSSPRPATPPKDTPTQYPPPPRELPPPTPPKSLQLKPESADSGYGGFPNGLSSNSPEGALQVKRRYSRESLDKELPPLPNADSKFMSRAPTVNAT